MRSQDSIEGAGGQMVQYNMNSHGDKVPLPPPHLNAPNQGSMQLGVKPQQYPYYEYWTTICWGAGKKSFLQ